MFIYKRDSLFRYFLGERLLLLMENKTPRSHHDYGVWKVFTREITY